VASPCMWRRTGTGPSLAAERQSCAT
jgi:hypothetical protein